MTRKPLRFDGGDSAMTTPHSDPDTATREAITDATSAIGTAMDHMTRADVTAGPVVALALWPLMQDVLALHGGLVKLRNALRDSR